MCQNIDDFNRGAAFVLAALYRAFPLPAVLKTASLDAGDDLADDEREPRLAERAAVYEAGVIFLMEEGFVRYTSHVKGAGIFMGVVLTSKGLAALNKAASLDVHRGPTLGDKLLGFAKSTATEAARDAIKQAVMAVLA